MNPLTDSDIDKIKTILIEQPLPIAPNMEDFDKEITDEFLNLLTKSKE